MRAFWDASALVPLCLPVQAGPRARQLLRESRPVVWWGTAVEVAGAIARLRREGVFSDPDAAARRFAMLRQAWREVQPIEEVRELAELQLERYDLRAGDALQLAAALVWCSQRPRGRIFVCRDARLTRAARAAGFTVVEY